MVDFVSGMLCHKEKTMYSHVPEFKFTLLVTHQANKSGDELWEQGIVSLFGKAAD